MVFGTRNLKVGVLGPSGFSFIPRIPTQNHNYDSQHENFKYLIVRYLGPLVHGNRFMSKSDRPHVLTRNHVAATMRGALIPNSVWREPIQVPHHRPFWVSVLAVVIMVLGRCLIVEYLDP